MGERASRPFWLHQLAEYMIGLALISYGFQDPEPVVPVLVGVVVMLNAAIVRGPFGAFKFVGRRLHKWLDVIVFVVILVGAVQPWLAIELTARAVLLVIAIPFAFLWWYTDWAERAQRKQRRVEQAGDRGDDIGKTAGRLAGSAFVAGKRAIKKRSES
jgi:hypothetical protein